MAEVDVVEPQAPAPTPTSDPGMGLGAHPPGTSPLSGPPIEAPVAPKADPAPAKAAPAAKAPAAPVSKSPASVAETSTDKIVVAPSPPDFPADWRAKWAGTDSALMKRLERFDSPKDVLTSYRALEQQLSSGDYSKKLATHASAEELADYRKANKIPDKPEGYKVEVEGLVIGETDKPFIDSWKEFAHERNMTPQQVNEGVEWWFSQQEAMVDRLINSDRANVETGDRQLRADWGHEYVPNLNALKNLFNGAGVDSTGSPLFNVVLGARTADGRKLGDNPDVLKFFVSTSKAQNPYATNVPDVGADPTASAVQRYAELSRLSADKQGAYWRGGQAAPLQAEMVRLIDSLVASGQMDSSGRLVKK